MSTNTKHPHCELIKKWADGAQIQYWSNVTGEWIDVASNNPYWDRSVKYRIRPETIRYRVALFSLNLSNWPVLVEPHNYATQESNTCFIRWLGDEQEVVV